MKLEEEERRLFIALGLISGGVIPSLVINRMKKKEDITMESQSNSSSACVNDSAMREGIVVISVNDKKWIQKRFIVVQFILIILT